MRNVCKGCGYVRPRENLDARNFCREKDACMARRRKRFTGRAGEFASEYLPPPPDKEPSLADVL